MDNVCVREGSAMTGPWIRLYFTPFFRSREATHWSVRDESEKTRPDSRSCTVATVERGHRRQKTRRFSAFRVLDQAYLEKGARYSAHSRWREAAPFNELLSRMIFLA